MSHVAKLSLCKKLYELSGWDNPSCNWYGTNDKTTAALPPSHEVAFIDTQICPAYDCGYLLNKLPKHLTVGGHLEGITLDFYDGKWSLRYGMRAPVRFEGRDEDFNNAACKLAIILWENGVFNRVVTS